MTTTEHGRVPARQLTRHHAQRIDLPGKYGPIAALRTSEPGDAIALLVPGYTGSKEDFAPLLDGCAAAGFQALAIDLPGQYESPGPEDEQAYSADRLGEVIAELVTSLHTPDRPVLLLGHSFGGLVSRAAVFAGAPIAGLTLLDSGPRYLPDGGRRQALDLGEPVVRAQGVAAAYALREQIGALTRGWLEQPEKLRDFYRIRFVASSAPGLLGMADSLRSEPDRTDELISALRAGGTPALVIAGERDDGWSPEQQREMAERLGAPMYLIPDAGHTPNTDNPAALLEVLLPHWRGWLGD